MKRKQLAISIACGLLTYEPAALAQGNLDVYGECVCFKRNDIDKTQLVEKTKHQTTGLLKDLEFECKPSCCNRFGFAEAYRVGVIYTTNYDSCFEINYLHIYPWQGKEGGDLMGNLLGLSDIGTAVGETIVNLFGIFFKTESVREEYRVAFSAGEANYCYYLIPRVQRYFSFATLLGLRYFRLEEKLQRSLYNRGNTLVSRRFIHMRNDMFGLQLGCLLQSNPDNSFYWNLTAKVGGVANNLKLEKSLQGKKEHIKPGFFTEVSAQVGWNLARWIKLYMGYEMLFLYGIGTAPEQISQRKHHIYHNSKTIFHGVSGGIAFTF